MNLPSTLEQIFKLSWRIQLCLDKFQLSSWSMKNDLPETGSFLFKRFTSILIESVISWANIAILSLKKHFSISSWRMKLFVGNFQLLAKGFINPQPLFR